MVTDWSAEKKQGEPKADKPNEGSGKGNGLKVEGRAKTNDSQANEAAGGVGAATG